MPPWHHLYWRRRNTSHLYPSFFSSTHTLHSLSKPFHPPRTFRFARIVRFTPSNITKPQSLFSQHSPHLSLANRNRRTGNTHTHFPNPQNRFVLISNRTPSLLTVEEKRRSLDSTQTPVPSIASSVACLARSEQDTQVSKNTHPIYRNTRHLKPGYILLRKKAHQDQVCEQGKKKQEGKEESAGEEGISVVAIPSRYLSLNATEREQETTTTVGHRNPKTATNKNLAEGEQSATTVRRPF